jgi:hypothetical protein
MKKNRKIVISTIFLTTLLFIGIIISFGKKTSNLATKIPAGTIIKTKMYDTIHTDKPYKDIKTKIAASVVDKRGKVIIPKGATLLGDYAIYSNKGNIAIVFRWKNTIMSDGSKYEFVLDGDGDSVSHPEIVEHIAVDENGNAVANAKKENIVTLKSFITFGHINNEEDNNELMQSKYYIVDPVKEKIPISLTINEITDLKIVVEQNIKLTNMAKN